MAGCGREFPWTGQYFPPFWERPMCCQTGVQWGILKCQGYCRAGIHKSPSSEIPLTLLSLFSTPWGLISVLWFVWVPSTILNQFVCFLVSLTFPCVTLLHFPHWYKGELHLRACGWKTSLPTFDILFWSDGIREKKQWDLLSQHTCQGESWASVSTEEH